MIVTFASNIAVTPPTGAMGMLFASTCASQCEHDRSRIGTAPVIAMVPPANFAEPLVMRISCESARTSTSISVIAPGTPWIATSPLRTAIVAVERRRARLAPEVHGAGERAARPIDLRNDADQEPEVDRLELPGEREVRVARHPRDAALEGERALEAVLRAEVEHERRHR